jgi:hypothetical protein
MSKNGSEEEERGYRRDDEALLVRPLWELLRERVSEIKDDQKEDENPRKVNVDVDAEEACYTHRTWHVPSILVVGDV